MLDRNKIKRAKMIKIGLAILAIMGTIAGIYLFYKLSFYVMPFIIAFIISLIVEPIIRFLMRKVKLPRKVAAPIVLLFFIFSFGTIIALGVIRLIHEIKSFSMILPDIISNLYTTITCWINKANTIIEWLPSEVTVTLSNTISDITKNLTNIVSKITRGAYTTAISIPEALLFLIITVLATYFISSDRERISKFFASQFPEKWNNKVKSIISDMFSAFLGYVKAQLIIMAITFIELFTGFLIIRIKYSLLLAFIISILDALPIVGTGGFLIPWAIYSFFNGEIRLGVSLIVLYGIALTVRQLLEPKIIGTQIGLHPLATLIAMYVGLKILGIFGLILGPIIVLVSKNVLAGVLKNKSIKDFFAP
ncbi:MAG: sporulation integral membrane protein YtvI [Clostridiaceae bacterium]|nr:sporulation integral membrane protein YtvI [Clostridiaceae bacterium]